MKVILLLIFSLCSWAVNGQIINASSPYRYINRGCTPDSDAQAFIDSTGISGTEAAAICVLVSDLKANSLWAKFIAIYPFVGSTASSQKWNLKNPQNTDAAFRLTFSGTWSHTSGGADPSTASFATTYIESSTDLSQDSKHLSYYSTENNGTVGGDIGNNAINAGAIDAIFINGGGGSTYWYLSDLANNNASNANTSGFYIASRTASNATAIYKNGSSLGSDTDASTGNPGTTIVLGAANGPQYGQRNCVFASIGSGLTSGEASTLNTIVEKFQDALGRGVQ